jgi:hypothetical protein
MKMKLGLVVDFSNYEDYYSRFNSIHDCEAVEFHVLEQEIDKDFDKKLARINDFIKRNNIRRVSFHTPDAVMQSVLYEEETAGQNKDKFFSLINGLRKLADDLGFEVILVVHQGIKLPAKMIDSMSMDQLLDFKKKLKKKAKEGYDWLTSYLQGSKLIVMLENSPPSCAGDGSYHFYDLAFEDLAGRIGTNGFVLDVSHAAMCVEYYNQGEQDKQARITFPALELLRKEHKGIPPSLKSMESYAKVAGKNTRWIHLNDANGIMGNNEGLPIPAEKSIINFKKLIAAIEKNIAEPIGVLEIVGSHKDFSLVEKSMKALLALMKD